LEVITDKFIQVVLVIIILVIYAVVYNAVT
jgi:hypothetical protein